MLSYCLGMKSFYTLPIFSSFPQSYLSTFLQFCCPKLLFFWPPVLLLACCSSLLDCFRSRFRGHYTTSPQTVLQCMANEYIYLCHVNAIVTIVIVYLLHGIVYHTAHLVNCMSALPPSSVIQV